MFIQLILAERFTYFHRLVHKIFLRTPQANAQSWATCQPFQLHVSCLPLPVTNSSKLMNSKCQQQIHETNRKAEETPHIFFKNPFAGRPWWFVWIISKGRKKISRESTVICFLRFCFFFFFFLLAPAKCLLVSALSVNPSILLHFPAYVSPPPHPRSTVTPQSGAVHTGDPFSLCVWVCVWQRVRRKVATPAHTVHFSLTVY